jgi:hypothetical protein
LESVLQGWESIRCHGEAGDPEPFSAGIADNGHIGGVVFGGQIERKNLSAGNAQNREVGWESHGLCRGQGHTEAGEGAGSQADKKRIKVRGRAPGVVQGVAKGGEKLLTSLPRLFPHGLRQYSGFIGQAKTGG